MAVDKDGNEIVEGRTPGVTPDGNAGVSERSESEIEAGADGAGKVDDDDSDAAEALDALGEADPKRATVGYKKRIAKLTAQRNKAREASQERDALKARVAAYEKREREEKEAAEAEERNTPEGLKKAERQAAVRRTIDETWGPGTSEGLDEWREERRLRAEQYAQTGVSFLRSELEDHDLPTDDTTLIRYERAVGSEMAEDPELLAAFRRPASQKAAIAEAFERVRDGIINPVLKQSGAKTLARITRNRESVLGGGRSNGAVAQAPEPEEIVPPKELKGAALDAWWKEKIQKDWASTSRAEG